MGVAKAEQQEEYRDFKKRSSLLEFRNVIAKHQFLSGFLVIFWVSTFYYFLNTVYQNKRQTNLWVGMQLASALTSHSRKFSLAIGHIFLVAWIPALKKAILKKKLNSIEAFLIQIYLAVVFPVLLWRRILPFSYIQRGILSMICMVNFMKVHSYVVISSKDKEKNSHELKAFARFYFAPTFIYSQQYILLSEAIDFVFIVEKLFMSIGCCFLAYILIEHYITPPFMARKQVGYGESLLQLIIPLYLTNILLFFAIFEGLSNAAAEITRFADREFYSDWWNSANIEEFARKWNKIVHAFLFKHVYLWMRQERRIPKYFSIISTFLLSALAHELVIATFTGRMNFVFFAMQMMQIPLIFLGRIPFFKQKPVLGNVFVMACLFIGPSIMLLSCSE